MEKKKYNMIKSFEVFRNPFGGKWPKSFIRACVFKDSFEGMVDGWDVSEEGDGSVMAWLEPAQQGLYKLCIAGEGGVWARDCELMFGFFPNIRSIDFNNCFHTEQVKSFSHMFDGCEELVHIHFEGVDMSNAEYVCGMFYECYKLSTADLISMGKATEADMANMFFRVNPNIVIEKYEELEIPCEACVPKTASFINL